MRHSQLRAALLLAMCLFGAAARAQTAASTTATAAGGADVAAVVQQLLSGGGVFQTAVPSTGGVAGSVKASLGSLSSAAQASMGAMTSALSQAGAQAEAALAAFEQQYCKPATFTPSQKVPATFVGHSMAVTFSMGNCTFNESKWLNDDIKVGARLAAWLGSAAAHFTSKVCKVTKTFGEPVEKVLFVFDGTQAPDINALTAQITEEVKKVLGTVGTGMSDIIGSTKSLLTGAVGATGAAPAFAYS
ncbi:hypothetical protein ABPG77_011293 [Micractinium sp. CCAP 211/92]